MRRLTAIEQKARHLQTILETAPIGQLTDEISELSDHILQVKRILLREMVTKALLRGTRSEEIDEIASELLNEIQALLSKG